MMRLLICLLGCFIAVNASQQSFFATKCMLSMKAVPCFQQGKLVEEFTVSVKTTDGKQVATADGWIGGVNGQRICTFRDITVVEQYRFKGVCWYRSYRFY